jgi:diaminohydroxyphosphoribosylaminopyrimidine deaminase/5-amino-6-(5-phosphoribosylamino)uracil reductase
MTLDGKLSTGTGDSRWVSCKASQAIVHRLRGRVDAIVVGKGTASADDPLLTPRPPGARVPLRIVLDSLATLSVESQLVRTARDVPVMVAVSPKAPSHRCKELAQAGCEVHICGGNTHRERLEWLLERLAERGMTNVLVEGGSQVLGTFFDAGEIDEVHAFIAPKLVGGTQSTAVIGGQGVKLMAQALKLESPVIEQSGDDVYVHGRIARQGVA